LSLLSFAYIFVPYISQLSLQFSAFVKPYRYLAFMIFAYLIHRFPELTERRSFKSHSIIFLDITWIITHANGCPKCERFYLLHSIFHSLYILISYSFISLSSGKRVIFKNCY